MTFSVVSSSHDGESLPEDTLLSLLCMITLMMLFSLLEVAIVTGLYESTNGTLFCCIDPAKEIPTITTDVTKGNIRHGVQTQEPFELV
jgi:hypothetical protein